MLECHKLEIEFISEFYIFGATIWLETSVEKNLPFVFEIIDSVHYSYLLLISLIILNTVIETIESIKGRCQKHPEVGGGCFFGGVTINFS